MKFVPKEIKENVNISKIHPIRELFILLGGILGGLLIIYLALGFSLDLLINRMPHKFENKLVNFFNEKFISNKSPSPAEEETQKILNELSQYIPGGECKFTVHITKSCQANAVALPGGHILLYSGIFKEIGSRNELTMILAHELGHYVHRDHLRGFGRGLVLTAISSVIFGADNVITEFLMRVLLTTDHRFSRQQETTADKFALELLNKKYGHVAGATDFFKNVEKKAKMPKYLRFFYTHPLHSERIDALNKEVSMRGYEIKEKIPLDSEIYSIKINNNTTQE